MGDGHGLPRPAHGTPAEPGTPDRHVWTSRRALVSHVVLVVWTVGCAVATWWQVHVALSGDSLGWIYSVMWPCFAVFAVIFWWHFIHDDPDTTGRRGLRRLEDAAELDTLPQRIRADAALEEAEADDPELAEYNAYLAALARDGRRGTWRGP